MPAGGLEVKSAVGGPRAADTSASDIPAVRYSIVVSVTSGRFGIAHSITIPRIATAISRHTIRTGLRMASPAPSSREPDNSRDDAKDQQQPGNAEADHKPDGSCGHIGSAPAKIRDNTKVGALWT